ncbi:DedA family protein [Spartinivicinus ruber]|uniref:DedA family protein n=1 Tax=Spartinivicinus ruber TaxID=2683272 RepID=UPI0013D3851B|nr:VTT domain-containing protein [Spartinivicinus ruber]
MLETLLAFSQHPLVLAILLVLVSYVLEDVAIVLAALLALDGYLPISWGMTAAFIGIWSGDLGLYGLGRLACRYQWAQRYVASHPRVKQFGGWLADQLLVKILICRLMPGLRFPGYVACGLYQLSLATFCLAISLATLVWTVLVFAGFYLFGELFEGWFDQAKWGLIPLALLLIWWSRRKAQQSMVEELTS